MNRLERKVAVVSGGARGIGRAICLLFAKEGARVAVTDIIDDEGKQVTDQTKGGGGTSQYWSLDTSDEKQVKQVIADVHQRLGGIHVLVNNAGISGTNQPTHEITEETTRIFKLTEKFNVFSVGIVKKQRDSVAIVVHKEYAKALLGLNQFSHIVVIYWFHKNDSTAKRKVLQVHPRGDKTKPLTGVFATRSPSRPNLIGISTCKMLSFNGNTVYIDEIDALHDSPVIDIKPYIPQIDLISEARVPWWVKNADG